MLTSRTRSKYRSRTPYVTILQVSSTGRHLRFEGMDEKSCVRLNGTHTSIHVYRGAYNALKVDVWSLGATIWELAETEPPFSDVTDPRQLGTELPPLLQPEDYSRSFHDFLNLCSRPSASRPDPHELLSVRPTDDDLCYRCVY